MSDPTSTEILDGAREYLETNGWMQGDLFPKGYDHHGDPFSRLRGVEPRPSNPPACLLGAVYKVAPRAMTLYGGTPLQEAVNRIGKIVGGDGAYYDIPTYNDAPERTAEDVILTLKRAAADE